MVEVRYNGEDLLRCLDRYMIATRALIFCRGAKKFALADNEVSALADLEKAFTESEFELAVKLGLRS